MTLSVGLIQLNSGDDPAANLEKTIGLISSATDQGAQFVLTPEVTNIVSASRKHQNMVLQPQASDSTLQALIRLAARKGIWLLIGSLALKSDDPEARFVNRSFMISPQGLIVAQYDKIHMFDVQVSETESYRESAGYKPGNTAVLAQTPFGALGLSICYDIRFPQLYRKLAQLGAELITVPSAFSPVTGAAHWHVLLRARAIETGAFILAPAQTGTHAATQGKPRQTFGHSLVVDPWGEILLDAGTQEGAYLVSLDLDAVQSARSRIPALRHDRNYQRPQNGR